MQISTISFFFLFFLFVLTAERYSHVPCLATPSLADFRRSKIEGMENAVKSILTEEKVGVFLERVCRFYLLFLCACTVCVNF